MSQTKSKFNLASTKERPSFRKGNWECNWVNMSVIVVPTLIFLYGLVFTTLRWQTLVWSTAMYYLTGISITAGYHRLWSHRAFDTHPLVELFFAIFGAAAYQGSARWWCRNHRVHHRYIDTDQDPYNATRGFWYAHMGWMLMKQDYRQLGRVDVYDLNSNPILQWQHKHYLPIAVGASAVFPLLVAGFGWGDWMGGLCFAVAGRICFVHHSTFFVNSLAHWAGFGAQQVYSDHNTSQDSVWTALVTLGEGYHNFHHEFPADYRNGIKFYHWDPTKWTIRALSLVGLASNLHRFPENEIERNKSLIGIKKLNAHLSGLDHGPKHDDLPVWEQDKFDAEVAAGGKLCIVDGYVIDVATKLSVGAGYTHTDTDLIWYDAHPGGQKILDAFVGKEASKAFHGGVYLHSHAALTLISRLRVAVFQKKED